MIVIVWLKTFMYLLYQFINFNYLYLQLLDSAHTLLHANDLKKRLE